MAATCDHPSPFFGLHDAVADKPPSRTTWGWIIAGGKIIQATKRSKEYIPFKGSKTALDLTRNERDFYMVDGGKKRKSEKGGKFGHKAQLEKSIGVTLRSSI